MLSVGPGDGWTDKCCLWGQEMGGLTSVVCGAGSGLTSGVCGAGSGLTSVVCGAGSGLTSVVLTVCRLELLCS